MKFIEAKQSEEILSDEKDWSQVSHVFSNPRLLSRNFILWVNELWLYQRPRPIKHVAREEKCPSILPSVGFIRELKQAQRQRRGKRHFKIDFQIFQTPSR